MTFNKLNPGEAERLYLLLEELGEAQQAIGKILRHGYESSSPLVDESLTEHRMTNRRSLEREIGDVMAALQLLYRAQDLNRERVIVLTDGKLERVGEWLHHQKKRRARRVSAGQAVEQ